MRLPKGFNPRSANSRRDLASRLREATGEVSYDKPRKKPSGTGDDPVVLELRRQIRQHPCHGCTDREQHARWAERYHRLDRETRGLERRVENRTNSIAKQFDRVCAILERLGYLTTDDDASEVTDAGRMLQRLYNDMDLVAAEPKIIEVNNLNVIPYDGDWNNFAPALGFAYRLKKNFGVVV